MQVHSDDISNLLILNKKQISNQENQVFKAELEKFRPHQNRLLQANHKQTSLMKELTRTYSDLLQDKRVRSEQTKYEAFSRQRSSVMTKYRKVYQSFNDLIAGLLRAQGFYSEMKETVESLQKNVDTFVNNRRSEGGQLLGKIENARNQSSSNAAADQREQERLKELMDRMSMEPPASSPSSANREKPKQHRPPAIQTSLTPSANYANSAHPHYNPAASPPITPRYPLTALPGGHQYMSPQQSFPQAPQNGFQPPPQQQPQLQHRESYGRNEPYNPNAYGPVSPPAHQQHFSHFSPPPGAHNYQQGYPTSSTPNPQHQQHGGNYLPQGYVPPPPPPGPPPNQQEGFGGFGLAGLQGGGGYPSGPGGYAHHPRQPGQQQQQQQGDPWAGLNKWA